MVRTLTLLVALTICSLAAGQKLKVEKYRLSNGMTVILHEDHQRPVVAVNIWYKVGSKDEPDRKSGFAHLFEHLMFMGTKRVPESQFDILMETHGGSNNASTSEDRTNYYETGPSNLLPLLLWLEADRLEDLAKEMSQQKLDLQREVVKNERRQGVDNAPYGQAYDSIPRLLFPKGHPYSWSVIGSMADLDNAAVADVQGFFNTYYVPNNASLVVAGDFDSQSTKRLIAKLFGTLPRGKDVPRRSVPPLNLRGSMIKTLRDNVQAARTIMVWHSPAAYQLGDVEMRLAGSLLSGGFTSRLYQALVVQKQLATDVAAYQYSMQLGSTFIIEATARSGVPLPKLEEAIDAALSGFRQRGPTQDELDRQLAQVSFNAVNRLQSLEQRADQLNEYEFYFGKPNSFEHERKLFLSATRNSIRIHAAGTLNPHRRLVLRVVPGAKPDGPVAKNPLLSLDELTLDQGEPQSNPRDSQPKIGPLKPFKFPLPAQFKLANGVPVYYWHKPSLPLMTLSIRLKRGAAQDPPAKAGLAELTADMLDEGAGSRDAAALTNDLEMLGAQLGTGADYEGTTLSLTSLEQKFEPALRLLSDVVAKPKLAAGDWKRIKELHLESLAQEDDDPATVARKIASREFFGPEHPYSRPVDGSAKSVAAISLADVKAAYKRTVVPKGAAIYASGSLSPEQLKSLLNARLGRWNSDVTPVDAQLPRARATGQRLLIVDRPGAVQTVIRILMPTEAFSSPNRYALTELGVAMGGTFTSRINRNLREDKGYTYGANLSYAFSKPVSYLVAATSVRSDVTGASIKEILAEIQKVRAGDLTEEEASKARNSVRMDLISSVSTIQGLVATAIAHVENGIPIQQISSEMAKFSNVNLTALNSIAKTGIPIERAVIVLVGDRNQIEQQLGSLALPKPEVVKL